MQHLLTRKRSGCLTCRSKKVKCDEQRSACGRCRRLALKCEWATASQSRGRDKARSKPRPTPKKILPNVHYADLDIDVNYSRGTTSGEIHDDAGLPAERILAVNGTTGIEEFITYSGTNTAAAGDDWYHELGFSPDFLDIGNFTAQANLDESPSESSTGPLLPLQVDANGKSSLGAYDEQRPTVQYLLPAPWLATLASPLNIFSPGLSTQNIVLSPSFAQTAAETQALHYYKTHFPTIMVTKNLRWSTHMVMLRHGSQTPMVMHLLIAASLMNLGASQHYDADICSAAREHSRAGVYLLIEAMNSSAEPDYLNVLTAFFFLYKYMAEQKNTNPDAMIQFSQAVCEYVKKYNLDALCAKSVLSCVSSTEVTARVCLPRDKQECLARLIVWIFYEDVAAGVRGLGGLLASHLCAEPEQTNEIYQCSTTNLESAWGPDYPESEIVDDIENGPILKLLCEVMMLYTEVNEVCRSSILVGDSDRIEAKILKLEERSRFLFRLTTITTQPRSRLMINADYMVSNFYALRIYKFRCFHCDGVFAITPPEVQSSLTAILQIAQRSFSVKQQSQMIGRFQWPLFIAGIETSDGIHKEWIRTKLKKTRLSCAFKRILEIQDKTGRRVSMPLVRQIMCGEGAALTGGEHQLLPSTMADGSR
ncbi:hypothetical protein VF21_10265 [Pseudogymnoascus sp. 05NY08]|nr:hypothetical protein VF21_10265 [Pseudogymnoascus sp. 05NY08]